MVDENKYDMDILKSLLHTGNHLNNIELERALKLNKRLEMELKRRVR